MVTIIVRPREFSEGKTFTETRLETIEQAAEEVLKNNLDLRTLRYRHFVKLIVEDKLRKKVSDESVPRAIRKIQSLSGKGLYRPEKPDNRLELQEEHREYYSASHWG